MSGVACPEPNCRLPITEDILKRIFGSDSPATWRQRLEWRGKIPVFFGVFCWDSESGDGSISEIRFTIGNLQGG